MRRSRILFPLFLVLTLILVSSLAPVLADDSARRSQAPGREPAPEPQVFPAEGISSPPYTPYVPDGAGILSSSVTFTGLWDGSCKVTGTYGGNQRVYTAGTFRMTVNGQSDVQGYCIDLDHTIRAGDSWSASIYAAREQGLCAANWILDNYTRTTPDLGLTEAEQGAAIQAAIWHYVAGFVPEWDEDKWCGNPDVFAATEDIITAADGQCVLMPTSLDLAASPTELFPGETSDLTATVLDQKSQAFEGQLVNFATTFGTLGKTSDSTDAQGKVANTITSDGLGTAQVTVSMAGSSTTAAVDDLSGDKQRILIIKNTDFSDEDSESVAWEDCLPAFDFEFDDDGIALPAGTIVTEQWADWGVHVTTNDPANHPAMIFDSSNPSGNDDDLGTPNEVYGGPGVGAGGATNDTAHGKILIISKDGNQSDPNDYAGGGTLIFTFDGNLYVGDVYLLDIEENGGYVRAYDSVSGGGILAEVPIPQTGDNGFQILSIDTYDVRRLEISLAGSGGVPAIVSCSPPPPPPTAVDLVSFEAQANRGAIVANWETASEIDNLGFNLYRAESPKGRQVRLNRSLIPSQVPPGSPTGAIYTFRDARIRTGVTYYYWLESVDVRGTTKLYGPVETNSESSRTRPRR